MTRNKIIIFLVFFGAALLTVFAITGKCEEVSNSRIPIASISDQNVFLYSLTEKDGMYNDLLLKVKNNEIQTNWRNTMSEHLPIIEIRDLNNDNKNELIIILTEGYGTGFLQQKIHILDLNNLAEYLIKSPMEIIRNNVKAEITLENMAKLSYDKKIINIDLNDFFVGAKKEIYFGEILSYEITENKLKAFVSVQVNDKSSVIGTFKITYSINENEFVKNKIEFEE